MVSLENCHHEDTHFYSYEIWNFARKKNHGQLGHFKQHHKTMMILRLEIYSLVLYIYTPAYSPELLLHILLPYKQQELHFGLNRADKKIFSINIFIFIVLAVPDLTTRLISHSAILIFSIYVPYVCLKGFTITPLIA